ncbi:MAG: hypothetical protein MK193_09980 [Lentisphaeria bacterium]|nr:hypothetical protein [Lentisphaeria bacterium]
MELLFYIFLGIVVGIPILAIAFIVMRIDLLLHFISKDDDEEQANKSDSSLDKD